MFSIYFSNFWEFFVFGLIIQSGIALLTIISGAIDLAGIPFLGLIFNIGAGIMNSLMIGGFIAMAADAKMKGKTSKSKAFSIIGKKALAIIVVNIILGLLIFLGICLCIIPAFFAMVYFLWATVIVVVEAADIGDSISKSTDFATEHKPYLFILVYILIAFVVGLIQALVVGIPQISILFGGIALFGSGVSIEMTMFIITVITAMITIPLSSFFGPFLPVFLTDYYIDSSGTPDEPMVTTPEQRRTDSLDW